MVDKIVTAITVSSQPPKCWQCPQPQQPQQPPEYSRSITTEHSSVPGVQFRQRGQPNLLDSTTFMIDSLVNSVLAAGDHVSCADELGALVDIAMFKDENAHMASHHAEQKLLAIYADPNISSEVRHDLIAQLVERKAILSEGCGQNVEAFAIPASLLHLSAQYARNQIADAEAPSVIDPSDLEEIKSILADATCLQDENCEGRDISDPKRFVTSDEMCTASMKSPCGYYREINLSAGVSRTEKNDQLRYLLDKAAAHGLVTAPLVVADHFMLIVVERKPKSEIFQITIANTNMAPDSPFAKHLNNQLFENFENHLSGRKFKMTVHHAAMQEHAINSCGPLVSLLAKDIGNSYKQKGFRLKKTMAANRIKFSGLNAQQQKDLVMAQRSRMIGDAVFHKNSEKRFVFPDRIPPRTVEASPPESEAPHL
jgi:hypothetical protein